MCAFARIFVELAQPGDDGETIMIDSTHLKAHRGGKPIEGRARRLSDGPTATTDAANARPNWNWPATSAMAESRRNGFTSP